MTVQFQNIDDLGLAKTDCSGSIQTLDIQIGQAPVPPSNTHELLLSFNFSTNTCTTTHPARVNLRLQPLEQDQVSENWWYEGTVKYRNFGSVRVAECQDYTVAIIEKPSVGSDQFKTQTRQAYCELLTAVQATQHTQVAKIWNYFNDINSGEGDSEKYKQFSIGRAQAFQKLGLCELSAPTGTAIGTQGDNGLVLIALASNRRFQTIENPRQLPAFNYPKIYGPCSPKFSRGGIVTSDSHKLYLISGTASVVGHASSFPYDTSGQINQTTKNLKSLCEAISAEDSEQERLILDGKSVLRVYLKNPDDYSVIVEELAADVELNSRNVIYLHGTICRKELMVEIDGIKVI